MEKRSGGDLFAGRDVERGSGVKDRLLGKVEQLGHVVHVFS